MGIQAFLKRLHVRFVRYSRHQKKEIHCYQKKDTSYNNCYYCTHINLQDAALPHLIAYLTLLPSSRLFKTFNKIFRILISKTQQNPHSIWFLGCKTIWNFDIMKGSVSRKYRTASLPCHRGKKRKTWLFVEHTNENFRLPLKLLWRIEI